MAMDMLAKPNPHERDAHINTIDGEDTTINKYEEARVWYDANWPCCIRVDIEWTCDGYDYPEHVVEWIKNDTTNWKKINDDNGGTYEYFARINQ
jgi:hypothetical protein